RSLSQKYHNILSLLPADIDPVSSSLSPERKNLGSGHQNSVINQLTVQQFPEYQLLTCFQLLQFSQIFIQLLLYEWVSINGVSGRCVQLLVILAISELIVFGMLEERVVWVMMLLFGVEGHHPLFSLSLFNYGSHAGIFAFVYVLYTRHLDCHPSLLPYFYYHISVPYFIQLYLVPQQLKFLCLNAPRPLPLSQTLVSNPFKFLSIFILVSLELQQSLDLEQSLDPDRSLYLFLLPKESFLDHLLIGDKDLFLCIPNLFRNSCLDALAGCNISESSSESYYFLTHAILQSKSYTWVKVQPILSFTILPNRQNGQISLTSIQACDFQQEGKSLSMISPRFLVLMILVILEAIRAVLSLEVAYHYVFMQSEFLGFV
ncbi:MAG: hypothetical protein EZS28_038974, partial [Streblomastix strix]